MGYDNSVFTAAERELASRRLSAEKLAEKHLAEVSVKVPEILQISNRLASTGLSLARLILNKDSNFEQKLSQLREENLEGQAQIKRLLVENGYPSDYLDVKYFCERCGDVGFAKNMRCDCFNALLAKHAVAAQSGGSQLKPCSFESFSLDYYKEPTAFAQMNGIFEHCKAYAESFSHTSPSLFMLGGTGLGKTHLSLSIVNEALAKGYNALYDSLINYLQQIEKEHFGRADTDTLKLLLEADLLVLDDLGAEFESGFYVSTIYNIINTRLNKGAPTIISSNLSPEQLQKRYNDRIVSRLFAGYEYLKFAGKDVRQQRRMKG